MGIRSYSSGEAPLTRLRQLLGNIERIAVAVSGGVDSMTLATAAHRFGSAALGQEVAMFHAVSPAVPPEATARVQEHAARERWQLRIVDAGEFKDENYRANPLNRCYFCKTNLYSTIAQHTGWQIVSGANTDDLGEYRPGLIAAKEHNVRHPFVEAKISKSDVRAIAHTLGLQDFAELPSSPCLSSRVETGIRVEPPLLALVNDIEQRMRAELAPFKPVNLRCRIRANLVAIEVDADCLSQISEDERTRLVTLVAQRCATHGVNSLVTFAPYRVGSAFLHERRAL